MHILVIQLSLLDGTINNIFLELHHLVAVFGREQTQVCGDAIKFFHAVIAEYTENLVGRVIIDDLFVHHSCYGSGSAFNRVEIISCLIQFGAVNNNTGDDVGVVGISFLRRAINLTHTVGLVVE